MADIRRRYISAYRPKRFEIQVTETGSEPVSLADLKSHMHETSSDSDSDITAYGKAARSLAERVTGRAIVLQTRVLKMTGFPWLEDQYIELPGGMVQSVTSVQYTDEAGATQTFTDYTADLGSENTTATISLNDGKDWPDTLERGLDVTITYVAGYDVDSSPAERVPHALTTAIKMIAADLHDRRHGQSAEEVVINPFAQALLHSYKIWSA